MDGALFSAFVLSELYIRVSLYPLLLFTALETCDVKKPGADRSLKFFKLKSIVKVNFEPKKAAKVLKNINTCFGN